MQIGFVLFAFVFDMDEGRRIACDFEFLGDDQCDRLTAVFDLIVVKRAERRAGHRHLILIAAVGPGEARRVLMGEHLQDAIETERFARIDLLDSPLGNGAGNYDSTSKIWNIVFAGVLCLAGHLRTPVGTVDRLADVMGRHVRASI